MNYRTILDQQLNARKTNLALRATLKPYGLTPMQWVILSALRDRGTCSVTAIARDLNTSLAFVTVSVNLLVSRGLVSKVPSAKDSRAVVLACTAEAGELLERIGEAA